MPRPRPILAIIAIAYVTSCATVPKRSPLPQEFVEEAKVVSGAEVVDVPFVRSWADEPAPWTEEWLSWSDKVHARFTAIYNRKHTYLALSGGGGNGAFGAGVLCGWTKSGDRPEFTMVTGVSTGALMAPFAFLGSEYDHVLEAVATTTSTDDIMKARGKIRTIRSDAAASSDPLRRLIERYVDEDIMKAIAAEDQKGRALFIGTTNLDSMRPVRWNIGTIANSGHPHALALIRRIILASASIPAAFPPVLINVEADGKRYDELHVDGGVAEQVFLYPISLDWERVLEALKVRGKPKVYVIRNSRFSPKYKAINNKLFPIARRSVESLIRTQGIGDLYRIYIEAERDGLDFNLAYIPDDFVVEPKEIFDPEYMTKLFERARKMATEGYPWLKMPPALEEAPVE